MAQPTIAVNGPCGEPPPIRGTADTIVDLPTKAFGTLPNAIACDPELDEGALVMLAARLTYAGQWVMTRTWASSLVRRGLGEHCYWRGLACLVDRSIVKRRRQARGRQGHGEVVDDRICLPPDAGEHSRRVERAWFNGRLSVKALAAVLFVRAQADGEAQPWRIARRFGWSLGTVKVVAEEACQASLIERQGGAQNPTYRACNSQNPRCKNPRSKKARCKNPRHLHSDQPLQSDQSLQKDQLLRKARKRAAFDLQGEGTDDTSGIGTATTPATAPPESAGGLPKGKQANELQDRTAVVLAAVAAERQRQTAAHLAEGERAIASGEREPWTPDLLRRVTGMGVDVPALVARYRKRTAGRIIDDPNAYLLAMANDAVAKQVGTAREVLAAVATDRATLAGSSAMGSEARARAENREALAQQLGGGDIAAGYAALAMIPDSPHRRSRVEAPGASGASRAAAPLPAAEGAMQLGALLPTLGVGRGLAGASTDGGIRP